ncbi:MAG: riboflavin synthase [Desulfobulbaceae bacterium]|nr:MAG: riboflavin synthase [Desulfobulbaceae bacterium]
MFTGIVQGSGQLKNTRPSGGGLAFELEADFVLDDPQEGESIAVNGACLTAYNISGNRFTVDVSPESLSRTTLGELRAGDQVNMERALRISDRLGGHIVSGHVDCVGRCKEIKKEGDFTILTFTVPHEVDRYIIEKGSITIDGISLTVNSCAAGLFSVSIIPHTMQVTTLGRLKSGSKVNIEVDIIGKYVEKLMFSKSDSQSETAGIDVAFLLKNGYL